MPPKEVKKTKNKSENKDATKKARGFNYQRQYAIYYFLEPYVKYIIEEGKFNNLVFEDITYETIENILITRQIKYHTDKERLNCSCDIFKTLNNENNLLSNNVYYVVSKTTKEENYDKKFINWKNKEINTEELYELLINLNKEEKNKEKIINTEENIHKPTKESNYQKCIDFFNKIGKEKVIDYLKKIIIEKGFSYKELVEEIEIRIQDIFKITNKKDIFYVRFKIFELFENNWFDGNNDTPLNVDDEINKIKNDLHSLPKESDKKHIVSFIEILKKTIFDENENSNTHLLEELKKFINMYSETTSIKDILDILNELSRIYKINKRHEINEYYIIMRKILCKKMLDRYKNFNRNLEDCEKESICSSIAYYHNHSINDNLDINRAKIAFLFDDEEKAELKKHKVKKLTKSTKIKDL